MSNVKSNQDAVAAQTRTTGSNPLVAESRAGTSVQFIGIEKRYGEQTVLHDFDLSVAPGEFVSLLGPSGCGKTTALRVLAGLESAQAGEVLVNGEDVSAVPTNHRDLGVVFQAYSLFPHLSAIENTLFGLAMRKVPRAAARERARDALALVGLEEFADRYPNQLSGGQQQRVALARALVTEPKVLLLDEPLSALDAKVRVQLRDQIRRLQLRLGITTLFVTHDQEEALAVSDRIAVMSQGGIEQIGTPEQLYEHPASPTVAAFVGLSSVVPGIARAGGVVVLDALLPLVSGAADGPVEVRIRPEHVHFCAAGDGVAAVVEESTFLGSLRRTRVKTVRDGIRLSVQHSASERLEFGAEVAIALDGTPVALA